MRRTKVAALAVAVSGLAALAGCHRSKWYDTEVEIDQMRVVRRDDAGATVHLDVELSYGQCPGNQDEVVRGGAEFARCMEQYKPGQKVPVKVEHVWTDEGSYVWRVHEIGGCKRPPDANDEASFAIVRECEDWMVHGVKVGFECNLEVQKKLVKACPWFAKH